MAINSSSLIKGTRIVETNRYINIELIRIMAMLAVVGLHYFHHGLGTLYPKFGTLEYVICWAIDGYLFICVNLFVLITGWCLVGEKFKVSRIVKLWVQVTSYSVLCTVSCKLLGSEIGLKNLLSCIFPLTTKAYWFVTAYAILLCISPVLNAAISAMNKFQHLMVIIGLTTVFSIMPTFFVWERDLLTTGMDYEWFMVLYIIAAYIRKYGIPFSRWNAIIGYFVCSSLTRLLRYPLGLISQKIIGSSVLSGLFFRYNSITVLAASVFMFSALLNINIKKGWLREKVLNIAPYTFAVYLVHDNAIVRNILWNAIPVHRLYNVGIFGYLGGLLFFVPMIFLVCCLIEKVRVDLMKDTFNEKIMQKIDISFMMLQKYIYNKLQ